MKKFAYVIILTLIVTGAAFAQAENGRPYLDKLYTAKGQLPINTLVADLEVYRPLENKKGGSSLSLSSKDKIIFKKPNKIKVDSIIVAPGSALDGKQATIISDGQNSWMYVSQGQYPVRKRKDPHRATLNLPPNIQTYAEDADNPCVVTGNETIKGIPTRVVKITDSGRSIETTIWVDTKRWVPVKMEEKEPKKKGEGQDVTTCKYRDFRKLKDGRWFPFVVEVHRNNQVSSMVVYKAISINKHIPDHIFEPMQKFIK